MASSRLEASRRPSGYWGNGHLVKGMTGVSSLPAACGQAHSSCCQRCPSPPQSTGWKWSQWYNSHCTSHSCQVETKSLWLWLSPLPSQPFSAFVSFVLPFSVSSHGSGSLPLYPNSSVCPKRIHSVGSSQSLTNFSLHLGTSRGWGTLTPSPSSQLFSSFAPDVQHSPENNRINPKPSREWIKLGRCTALLFPTRPLQKGRGTWKRVVYNPVFNPFKKFSADCNVIKDSTWDRQGWRRASQTQLRQLPVSPLPRSPCPFSRGFWFPSLRGLTLALSVSL